MSKNAIKLKEIKPMFYFKQLVKQNRSTCMGYKYPFDHMYMYFDKNSTNFMMGKDTAFDTDDL